MKNQVRKNLILCNFHRMKKTIQKWMTMRNWPFEKNVTLPKRPFPKSGERKKKIKKKKKK